MRVGLRRLRAAISVFKDVVENPQTESVKSELKWLSGQLGPARDFDVFVQEGVAPLRRANPDQPEMKLLEADLKEKRDKGFERAKAAVGSERYRRIVLDTALWLSDGEWLRDKRALAAARRDRPIDAFARDVVSERTRKIVKKCSKIEDLDARERHKLRIAVKKLRYAASFFSTLLSKTKAKKARKRFEQELKALQDALGKLNDMTVHQKVARRYANARPRSKKRPQKAFAAGVLTGREQSRSHSCLVAARQAGKGLAKADAFWRQ